MGRGCCRATCTTIGPGPNDGRRCPDLWPASAPSPGCHHQCICRYLSRVNILATTHEASGRVAPRLRTVNRFHPLRTCDVTGEKCPYLAQRPHNPLAVYPFKHGSNGKPWGPLAC
eukprot:9778129-Karenia_brevis.AAC.1